MQENIDLIEKSAAIENADLTPKRRPRRTLEEKIADLKKHQEEKKLKAQERKVKYTGKKSKKNTLATPLNTKKVANKIKEMEREMVEEIDQKMITDDQIMKALSETGGNVSRAAKMLRLHDVTLYRKIKGDAELSEYMEILNQRLIDKAKDVIDQKLEEGDLKAALFVMETKGSFNKKQIKELSGRDGKAIEVNNTAKEAVQNADKIIKKALTGILE